MKSIIIATAIVFAIACKSAPENPAQEITQDSLLLDSLKVDTLAQDTVFNND